MFDGDFDLADNRRAAKADGCEGLDIGRTHQQPIYFPAAGGDTGSTRMFLANSSLMPRRELQTRQIKLEWRLRSRMRCCSQKPNSRRRSEVSGVVVSCLMQTTTPTCTRLSGQRVEPAHWSPWTTYCCVSCFPTRLELSNRQAHCKNESIMQNACDLEFAVKNQGNLGKAVAFPNRSKSLLIGPEEPLAAELTVEKVGMMNRQISA